MAASMSRSYVTQKFRTSCSYSRLSVLRFYQKRFLNEAAIVIPPPKYSKNEKGYLDQPEPQRLPEGLELDPVIDKLCEEDPLRYPKRHVGLLLCKNAPYLPTQLLHNARQILEEKDLICNKQFATQVKSLSNVLFRRVPPQDMREKEQQKQMIANQLMTKKLEELEKSFDDLGEEEQQKLVSKITSAAQKVFNYSNTNWKSIDYSKKMAFIYLASRLTPNYSVLEHIFKEIQTLDREFEPSYMLDVGSGIGSAVWAANTTWADTLREYYNVDASGDMNDLARVLLAKDINNPEEACINGVLFRQFVPSPQHIENRFSLVVSAYMLMDLPNRDARLNLVYGLWKLTENYLVLVEQGSQAGYHLIQEARDLVLRMKEEDPAFEAHVFAPCTHDSLCPKLQFNKSPCTFTMKYRRLNLDVESGQGDTIYSERFSYVVLKKGPKSNDDQYPRLTHIIHKSKCSHCHICCPDGSLRHYVFSKHKQRHLFKCLSKSQPGDLLPVLWPQPNSDHVTYLTDTEQPGEITESSVMDTKMDDTEGEITESSVMDTKMGDTEGEITESSVMDTKMADTEEEVLQEDSSNPTSGKKS